MPQLAPEKWKEVSPYLDQALSLRAPSSSDDVVVQPYRGIPLATPDQRLNSIGVSGVAWD
jgi:hypothetical protein